jgi:hypothetical protein
LDVQWSIESCRQLPPEDRCPSRTWDGKDGYGRSVQGFQQATIRISYVYGGVYFGVDQAAGSFGDIGTTAISVDLDRIEIHLTQEQHIQLGNFLPTTAQSACPPIQALACRTVLILADHEGIARLCPAMRKGSGARRSCAASAGSCHEGVRRCSGFQG